MLTCVINLTPSFVSGLPFETLRSIMLSQPYMVSGTGDGRFKASRLTTVKSALI